MLKVRVTYLKLLKLLSKLWTLGRYAGMTDWCCCPWYMVNMTQNYKTKHKESPGLFRHASARHISTKVTSKHSLRCVSTRMKSATSPSNPTFVSGPGNTTSALLLWTLWTTDCTGGCSQLTFTLGHRWGFLEIVTAVVATSMDNRNQLKHLLTCYQVPGPSTLP